MKSAEALMETVREAETLIGDFISKTEEILEFVQGTEAEAFDSIDELKTVDNALAGAFRFHTGHPKESGEYLAISVYGTWYIIPWSQRWSAWNAFDHDDAAEHAIEDSTFVGYFDLPDVQDYVRLNDE